MTEFTEAPVIEEPLPTPEAVESEAPVEPEPETPSAKESADELNRYKKMLDDERTNARYWAEKAKAAPVDKASKPTHQDMSGEELLEAQAKNGTKGLRDAGFMTRADFDEEVSRIREESRIEIEQRDLVSAYPGLKDEHSDFHKAAREEVVKRFGDRKISPAELSLVCEVIELRKGNQAPMKAAPRHIPGQGTAGTPAPAPKVSGPSLTASDRQFLADNPGVKEADLIESKKKWSNR